VLRMMIMMVTVTRRQTRNMRLREERGDAILADIVCNARVVRLHGASDIGRVGAGVGGR
jgi:hypothetical protein